jgi:PAS domain S-box-containing protein
MTDAALRFDPVLHSVDDLTDALETPPRLLDHLPMAVYACDATGRLRWFNRRAAELWGRTPIVDDPSERYCGAHRLFFGGRETTHDQTPMAQVLRTGKPAHDIEGEILRPDGSRIWIMVHIDPVKRADGGVVGAINCFHDITDHKRGEARLVEQDQRLDATYEHAGLAISEVAADGRLLRVNEATCATTGYPREELLALTVFDVTHPEDRPRDQQSFRNQLDGADDRYAIEKRLVRKDGGIIWVNITSSTVRDAEGTFLFGIRVLQDITERKRAEEALRNSEQRLREILAAMPAAIYTTDADGRLTFYNRAAVDLWGCEPELGTSRWCGSWQLYYPDGRPMAHDECPMAITLRQGRPVVGAEAVAERPDGTRVPFIPHPTPLHDASGRLIGAVNMLVDITERKRAEARQKTLLDELNHRVKNTLATVQSLATQTIRGSGVALAVRRTFEGRLFALSRAHDQLTRTQWESADLKSILEDIFAPFGSGEQSRVALDGTSVKLPPQPALLLAMVLHELATNAAKYGSLSVPNGCLGVRWAVSRGPAPPRLEIDWRENGGPPIRPPTRKGFGSRLFERAIRQELNGESEVAYTPDGLRCRIEIPMPRG